MKFNPLIPELYVLNFNKSINFYTKILGFKVEYSREDPSFAFLSYSQSQLMIQEKEDEWTMGLLEYPFGRGINLQIETKEIDRIVDSLNKKNYPIKKGLERVSYKTTEKTLNLKEFLVMDPDGYLLRFSQEIE